MSVTSAVTKLVAIGVLLTPALAASAQRPASEWELRFTSGKLMPTGIQRDALKPADVSAAQVAWVVRPAVAITGTFGWARGRDLTTSNAARLDVFTSDVGVELRYAEWDTGLGMTFSPLVGAGGGVRSYNHRSLDVDATHNLTAYAAVGGEFGRGRVGVRVELRDYTSGFGRVAGGVRAEVGSAHGTTSCLPQACG